MLHTQFVTITALSFFTICIFTTFNNHCTRMISVGKLSVEEEIQKICHARSVQERIGRPRAGAPWLIRHWHSASQWHLLIQVIHLWRPNLIINNLIAPTKKFSRQCLENCCKGPALIKIWSVFLHQTRCEPKADKTGRTRNTDSAHRRSLGAMKRKEYQKEKL